MSTTLSAVTSPSCSSEILLSKSDVPKSFTTISVPSGRIPSDASIATPSVLSLNSGFSSTSSLTSFFSSTFSSFLSSLFSSFLSSFTSSVLSSFTSSSLLSLTVSFLSSVSSSLTVSFLSSVLSSLTVSFLSSVLSSTSSLSSFSISS